MKQICVGLVVVLFCAGCRGSGKQSEEQKTAQASDLDPVKRDALRNTEAEGPAPNREKLRLIASCDDRSGDAPTRFDVELAYTPHGKISGVAKLDGSELDLYGVMDDGQFRVWALGNVGDAEKVRRGYLIGEIQGDDVSGTFAISGNGGTPNYKGTLKKR